MANPRKFSEKIALHHQKQAEETAAFEQIMREVSDATSRVTKGLAPVRGPLRAGSLPDVSQVPPAKDPETPRPKPDEQPPQYMGPTVPQSQTSPMPQQQTRGRSAGGGPIRTKPQDRQNRLDTSPYGSTIYLSPPPETNWRRTNSDSALHQSTVPRDIPVQGSPHHHHGSNLHHQASSLHNHQQHHHSGQLSSFGGQSGQLQHHHYSHSHHGLNTALHHSQHMHRRDGNNDGMNTMLEANPNRPRSSCDVPRVPGIHVYPSAHDNGVNQISVGNNTGSLPDLSSVHFPIPQPHPSPLDCDNPDHSSSPFSQSPSVSPSTLSPTSVPPLRQGHSPHHSPRSTPQTGSPTALTHYSNHQAPQKHLSVPNTNRYLHHSKGVTLDSTWVQGNYQQPCSPPPLHSSHSNINLSSPTIGVTPSQVSGASNGGYRSPRSPGSSPGGAGGGGDSPHYDASSGGAYTSPSADSYYNQAFLQNFEHISMDWAQLVQSLVESGVTWTAQVQVDSPAATVSFINSINQNQPQFSQASLPGSDGSGSGGNTSWAGGGCCSRTPACLQAGSCLGGAECLPGPHPNTPTNIPDIILTDFSSTSGDPSRDLNSSLPNQFNRELTENDNATLFTDFESLRDGLDPIDYDGFQMLTDPEMNVITDPNTEATFRLDRL